MDEHPRVTPSRGAIAVTCLLLAGLVLGGVRKPAPATAATSGKVISLKEGKLFRKTGEDWKGLSIGDQVSYGDSIKTDDRAVAILTLPGKGNFVVGPNTHMTLGEDKKEFGAKVVKGSVWIDAKLPKGTTLSVTSPTSVAGVRGTRFSVLSDDDGGAVCTCSGELDVTLSDGSRITSTTGTFVPVDKGRPGPEKAVPDFLLLRRKRNDRYQWCFNCHEVGGRGELKRDWAG